MGLYDEFAAFIAGLDARRVAEFQVSDACKERVADLLRREKEAALSAEETSELEQVLQLEHIMRLAKARARQLLVAGTHRETVG